MQDLILIAGPCVIESKNQCRNLAFYLSELAERHSIPFVFKASYDKANRTSLDSYRGVGIKEGLEVLEEIHFAYGVQTTTDVHRVEDVERVSSVVDIIQIPAFLCRQTDLLIQAGTWAAINKRTVNIKKGQFLHPAAMQAAAYKVRTGAGHLPIPVWFTERGTTFGYDNLVVDMRNFARMRPASNNKTIFDATHSVQSPGANGTGGNRKDAKTLACAAVAAGCDGVFFEVAIEPDLAWCDSKNTIRVEDLETLYPLLNKIHHTVQ